MWTSGNSTWPHTWTLVAPWLLNSCASSAFWGQLLVSILSSLVPLQIILSSPQWSFPFIWTSGNSTGHTYELILRPVTCRNAAVFLHLHCHDAPTWHITLLRMACHCLSSSPSTNHDASSWCVLMYHPLADWLSGCSLCLLDCTEDGPSSSILFTIRCPDTQLPFTGAVVLIIRCQDTHDDKEIRVNTFIMYGNRQKSYCYLTVRLLVAGG